MFFNREEKLREKERMKILELRVKRLEELQKDPNNPYVCRYSWNKVALSSYR